MQLKETLIHILFALIDIFEILIIINLNLNAKKRFTFYDSKERQATAEEDPVQVGSQHVEMAMRDLQLNDIGLTIIL